MSYTHLTKPQLVDIVKRCTGSAGDYARKTKQEYEAQVAGLPAEDVQVAAQALGIPLISGVWGGAQAAALDIGFPATSTQGDCALVRESACDFENFALRAFHFGELHGQCRLEIITQHLSGTL